MEGLYLTHVEMKGGDAYMEIDAWMDLLYNDIHSELLQVSLAYVRFLSHVSAGGKRVYGPKLDRSHLGDEFVEAIEADMWKQYHEGDM